MVTKFYNSEKMPGMFCSVVIIGLPLLIILSLSKLLFAVTPQISGGISHTLSLASDGTVWAWEDNKYDQLGDGTNSSSNVPVQVSDLSDVISIAAGDYHNLAVKSDGTVWAWGTNWTGQLGNGTYSSSNIPVQVTGLSDVIAVAAGLSHSLAVKSNGTVWTWGDNEYGQLGNGLNSGSNVPVQVSGLSDAIAVAAGLGHSLTVKSDSTVFAWGYNSFGQIGDAVSMDKSSPVQVQDLNLKSLLLRYQFEEGSGTVAGDSSGNGYDGTINGNAAWTTGENGNGGGLSFDGVDDYVDVGDMDLTEVFTLAAWINISNLTKGMIIGKTYQTYQLFVTESGNILFQRNSGTALNYNAGLGINTWHHVAVTFDTANGMSLYLDGSLVDTNSDTSITAANDVSTKIGATGATAKNFFNGIIDEVCIYNRALSSQEVQNLVNNNVWTIEISNSGFEEGTDGWVQGYTEGTDCSFIIDSDAYEGLSAAKLIITNNGYCEILNNPSCLIEKTGIYSLIVYSKVSGNPEALSISVWKSSEPDVIPNDFITGIRITEYDSIYQLYKLDNIPLSDGEYIRLSLGIDNGLQGMSEVWFDQIMFTTLKNFQAYYSFDDCSGDDVSGNGNHGIINGATCVTGKSGNGLSFDGIDDYVDIGDLDLTESFTLAAWINISSLTKGMIIGKTYQTYQVFVDANGNIRMQKNSGTPINYNAGLVTGTWYHVAVTFDTANGNGMTLYLDGNVVDTDPDTAVTNTNNFI
ncbi:MAG: hypothetical protein E3K37_13075 [Candidatus Kuenenia sp.]|nr:hypothetical protein [Candidatus Kuenenia hertensis]